MQAGATGGEKRRDAADVGHADLTDQQFWNYLAAKGGGKLDPSAPGMVLGRHFTTFVEEVKELKRRGENNAAVLLLSELVVATEAEDAMDHFGVAPWYYEQLAILYRRQGDLDGEIAVLERYASHRHAQGVKPPRLLDRLQKAKLLRERRPGESV